MSQVMRSLSAVSDMRKLGPNISRALYCGLRRRHICFVPLDFGGFTLCLIAFTAKIGTRLASAPPARRLATRFMKFPG